MNSIICQVWGNATEIGFPGGCFVPFFTSLHQTEGKKKVFGKLFSCKSCWRRWKIYWILPLPPTPKLLSCGGLDDPGCGGNLLTVFFNLRRWKCLLFFKLLQVLEKQESLQRETRLGMNEIGNMKWINSTMIFLWKPEYSKAEYSNYVELPLHPPLPHHAEKLSGKVRNSSFAVRFTCSCTTSKILIKLLFLFFIKLHAQSAFKQSPEQRQKNQIWRAFVVKLIKILFSTIFISILWFHSFPYFEGILEKRHTHRTDLIDLQKSRQWTRCLQKPLTLCVCEYIFLFPSLHDIIQVRLTMEWIT